MKNLKKLGYTLALSLGLLSGVMLFSPAPKASAETIQDMSQICVPPYKSVPGTSQKAADGWVNVAFTDRAHMTITYKANGLCKSPSTNDSSVFFGTRTFSDIFKDISGQADTIFLTDSKADGNVDYGEQGGGQDSTQVNHFGGPLDNLMKDNLNGRDKIVKISDLTANLQKAQIVLSLESDKVGYRCSDIYTNENFVLKDGNPPYWECNSSTDVANKTGMIIGAGNFTNLENFNITYTTVINNGLVALKSVFPNEQNNRTFVWCPGPKEFINNNCQGNLRIKATSTDISNLGGKTKTFTLTDGETNVDVVVAGNENATSISADGKVPVGGTEDPCVQNSRMGMEFLFCPIINSVIGGITGLIDKGVESQLDFKTDRYLSPDVYRAWSVFKDIVSAVVVIIMLVMIISQALDFGPFSAYTIKKLMPKLVIAIIAMQLSWSICIWLISLANDAGNGIGQIIAAPFGGVNNLQLGQLLVNLNPGWAAATFGAMFMLAIFSTTIGVLFLPGIALLVFSAFLSVLIAVVSLLFRNALIVILVMLSPIGFLAWVLPNTQTYWKMWKDNFTRLLLLFPIMMSLIYGGRAFAYVVGGVGQRGNPGFMDFIMVLVGYFVPYAMLPKAFKWGGSFMKMAYANTVDNGAFKKLRDTGNRMIGQDFNKYWKGRMARDLYSTYDRKARIGKYKVAGLNIPMMRGRIAGRLGAQHLMPTAHGRAQTEREGADWAKERREDATAFNRRRFEQALEHGYAVDKDGNAFIPEGEPDENGFVKDKITGKRRQLGYRLDEDGVKKINFWARGTGAAKQALVDMTSEYNSGDERISKDAQEQLSATNSNPEIFHNTVSYGDEAGLKVTEVGRRSKKARENKEWYDQMGSWDKEHGGNNTLYGEDTKSRYEQQVHIRNLAYGKNPEEGVKIQDRTMTQRMLDDLGDTPLARQIKDKFKWNPTKGESEGDRTVMAPHHISLYSIAHDMGLDAFGTQSLGEWQTDLRNAQRAEKDFGDTEGAQEIGRALTGRFEEMTKLGEGGAAIMRPLLGGEKGGVVNDILALDPRNLKGWQVVEEPIMGEDGKPTGDTELKWQPSYKTVEDFAKEAHNPDKAVKTGAFAKPAEPPTREYIGKNYYATQAWRADNWERDVNIAHENAIEENDQRDGVAPRSRAAPAPSATPTSAPGPAPAPAAEPGPADSLAVHPTSTAPRTGSSADVARQEIVLNLHPDNFNRITEAVERGMTNATRGINIQAQGSAFDEEMRNEFRRLRRAIAEGNATPEEAALLQSLTVQYPDIERQTRQSTHNDDDDQGPIGGA